MNAVVPAEQVMAEAGRWAESMCKCGPLALRAAKRAMVEGCHLPLDEGLAVEQRLFNSLAYTEDVREGLAAFSEKRPPQFKAK